MAASKRSENARRRLAAYNFLSNISLDGTHRDTKYKIFNQRGLFNSIEHSSSCGKRSQLQSECSTGQHGQPNDPEQLASSVRTAGKENKPREVKEKLSPSACLKRGRSISLSEDSHGEDDDEGDIARNCHRFSLRNRTISASEEDSAFRVRLSSRSKRVRQRSMSSSVSSVCTSIGAGRVTFIGKPFHDRKDSQRQNYNANSRVILLTPKRTPFMVYSTLPYTKKIHARDTENTNKRCPSSTNLSAHPDGLLSYMSSEAEGQDVSYGHLLVPSRHRAAVMRKMSSMDGGGGFLYPIAEAHSSQSSPVEFDGSGSVVYNPNLLDDPELRSGKHRTLMTFPSYMTSVIDYVRPSDLKQELNEKFRERFPNLQLTLSKLRSLKKDMRRLGHVKCNLDTLIIAEAYVFFEKIILKGFINKPNRKLVAGACLMLAAKLNDVKGENFSKLIEEIDDTFKVHRKELLATEFGILVALEFGLHVPDSEINPHHQRLMYSS